MSSKSIAALAAVKNAIRSPYAWPGGYPLYVLMGDGEALSVAAARENWSQIVRDTLRGPRQCWAVAGTDINWEDAELVCAHSGLRIESAYAENDA